MNGCYSPSPYWSDVSLFAAVESKVLVLEKEMSVLRAEHSSGVSELEQLRRSTTNQQSEFRASTRERENLLQEASQKFRGECAVGSPSNCVSLRLI